MDKFQALNFMHETNFLSHAEMEALFAADEQTEGKTLTVLSEKVSQCLHEDWRQNLVNEKGKDYQHWRALGDPEREKEIIAKSGEYSKKLAPDGKYLYRFLDENNKELSGDFKPEDVKQVQFDLIRMDFDDLTTKWKNANLKAARYAVALIKTGLDKGVLQKNNANENYIDLENMSHDVHIEWMQREQGWADPRLFVPYELLTGEEQSKDRAQLLCIMNGLSFKSNILARNRAIVVRALSEVMKGYSDEDGLKQQIMENLAGTEQLIEDNNKKIEARYAEFKGKVKKQTLSVLKGKEELDFASLEEISKIYYREWKEQASSVMKLPKAYEESYDNHPVTDPRLNFKNAARLEMADLVKEMVSEGLLPNTMLKGAEAVGNDKSTEKIRLKMNEKNEEDYANYQAMLKGNVKPE